MDRIIGFDPQLLSELFWTALNVLILFFGLSYFLFNPVRNLLEKRKQKITGELADAARDKEAAEALKAEYEGKLKEVSKEADAILEEARRKGKAREAEIIEEAKAEAARIIERGSREMELERKKALDDMKREIVSLASAMAGKFVTASMDASVQNALIEETLKEMGESTWQS